MGIRGGPLSDDVRDFESVWRVAGARASEAVERAGAVAVLGDDPVATAAAAIGLARAQAQSRRVFLVDLLGEGSSLASLAPADDAHGVSDMVHFGVSLRRASYALAEMPNLSIVPGGAETPLADDVLESPVWRTLFSQARSSGALMLVAAPALVPAIAAIASQADGVVLVGDGVASPAGTLVLAQVRMPAMRPAASRAASTASRRPAPAAPRSIAPYLLLLSLVVGGALYFPRWRASRGVLSSPSADSARPLPSLDVPPPLVEDPPPPGGAGFGVQLYFVNSSDDANATLARTVDSLPAVTYAIVRQPGDSADWFRLVAGAFPDSIEAENFLASIRDRGTLATGAGRVVRAPFAFLLDSAQSDDLAALRRSAYRGRGIPAYALRDSVGTWRIYAGAFAAPNEGALLKQRLDSLNIQSVLVTRTGSGL